MNGDNLRYLAVISQREILLPEASYGVPGSIGNGNIKPDYALCSVRTGVVFKIKRCEDRRLILLCERGSRDPYQQKSKDTEWFTYVSHRLQDRPNFFAEV